MISNLEKIYVIYFYYRRVGPILVVGKRGTGGLL